jgi:4-amino-4-deoxy-L-arabinose transferase-like glycosyltransferase
MLADRLLPRLSALILFGLALFAAALLAGLASAGVPAVGWGIAAAWLALATLAALLALRAPLWAAVLVTALAAILLRVLAMRAMNGLEGVQTGNDYAAYLALAGGLLDGSGLVAGTAHYGAVTGMYPPLYPLVLAGAGALFGVNSGSVLLVNGLIDFGAAALILAIAGRLDQAPAGRAAAALYLLWPNAILSAPLAQKEGLTILIALLLAWFFLRALRDGPGQRAAAGFGVTAALLALCQPALFPFPALLALMLLPSLGRRRLAAFLARALPFALAAMLPWWIRNWLVFGTFVPFTTSMGASLLVAAQGAHQTLGPDLASPSEPARSSALAGRATALIAQDPFGFLYHRGAAAVRALATESDLANRLSGFTPPYRWAPLMPPALQLSHVAALGLAFWSFAKGGARPLAPILAAAWLQMFLIQPWFELGERHRMFVMPFILLAAAIALAAFARASPRLGEMCIQGA